MDQSAAPQDRSLRNRTVVIRAKRNTQDTDIPHRTSVAKAIHEKVYKVTNILKDLFAVSLLDFSLMLSLHIYTRRFLGRYLQRWTAGRH